MEKKLNAIRVGSEINKVYIDFSSFESLKESSGFDRLYTIHTQNTLDMSKVLKFHVGGFCDDRGHGGTALAAATAGYPTLPSDLILCKMDDKYNFLPLEENELDALYNYLTHADSEEYMEEAEDDEYLEEYYDYFLLVTYSYQNKDNPTSKRGNNQLAFPLGYFQSDELGQEVSFPGIDGLFEIVGVDQIQEMVNLNVNQNGKMERIDVKVDEKQYIKFDFVNKDGDHVSGEASFNLIHIQELFDTVPGVIEVTEKYVDFKNSDNDHEEVLYIDDLDSEKDDNEVVFENKDMFAPFLFGKANNQLYLIVYGYRLDKVIFAALKEKQAISERLFIKNDEVNEIYDLYFEHKKPIEEKPQEKKQPEENIKDKEYKLHLYQEYYVRDTTGEFEHKNDYYYDLVEGKQEKIGYSEFYLTIESVDEKNHIVSIRIRGERYQISPDNVEEYKYNETAGYNDHWHSFSTKIRISLEKVK